MYKIFYLCCLLLSLATADLFLRLDHIPQHETNLTLLCTKTMLIEQVDVNITQYCVNSANTIVYTSYYQVVGVRYVGVTGNGYRLPPTDLNSALNASGFFVDSAGTVVAVVNYWDMINWTIVILWTVSIALIVLQCVICAFSR